MAKIWMWGQRLYGKVLCRHLSIDYLNSMDDDRLLRTEPKKAGIACIHSSMRIWLSWIDPFVCHRCEKQWRSVSVSKSVRAATTGAGPIPHRHFANQQIGCWHWMVSSGSGYENHRKMCNISQPEEDAVWFAMSYFINNFATKMEVSIPAALLAYITSEG